MRINVIENEIKNTLYYEIYFDDKFIALANTEDEVAYHVWFEILSKSKYTEQEIMQWLMEGGSNEQITEYVNKEINNYEIDPEWKEYLKA